MSPGDERVIVQSLAEERTHLRLDYFDAIRFTSNPIEQVIWHLANQKMHSCYRLHRCA